jgi:hypothetical protein
MHELCVISSAAVCNQNRQRARGEAARRSPSTEDACCGGSEVADDGPEDGTHCLQKKDFRYQSPAISDEQKTNRNLREVRSNTNDQGPNEANSTTESTTIGQFLIKVPIQRANDRDNAVEAIKPFSPSLLRHQDGGLVVDLFVENNYDFSSSVDEKYSPHKWSRKNSE